MTIENLEQNGNQIQEGEQHKQGEENKQEVALSVQDKRTKAGLQLKSPQQRALPNNRPIEASHLKIVDSYSSVGAVRPITAGEVKMSGTLTLSGKRPIGASNLQVSETYVIMGNRPVASNEIDDPASLMGFID